MPEQDWICVKCDRAYAYGGTNSKVEFFDPPNPDPEYLEITCSRCGYKWEVPTEDAP